MCRQFGSVICCRQLATTRCRITLLVVGYRKLQPIEIPRQVIAAVD
jgi:hypothetical protein